MSTNNSAGAQTVAVGMSGGIDSSVAAYLLQKRGFRVVGLTMVLWDGSIPLPPGRRSGCFGPGEPEDVESAERTAQSLGIEILRIPVVEEYKREVLRYFCSEYRAGRTPNPCVRCNQAIKFGLLLTKAREAGVHFDFFATGHYCRTEQRADGRVHLLKGKDKEKDQSYFLARLQQEQLRGVIFPLGELTKEQIRETARGLGWDHLLRKHESQDFVDSSNYGLLFEPEDAKPGKIFDRQGNIVGEHKGLIYYTIGQRRGVGVSGLPYPVYVTALDQAANAVVVGPKADLYKQKFTVDDVNWIALDEAPVHPLQVKAKIRQKHQEAEAIIFASASGVIVEFAKPQMSITPGQTAVFYRGEELLAGGTISTVIE